MSNLVEQLQRLNDAYLNDQIDHDSARQQLHKIFKQENERINNDRRQRHAEMNQMYRDSIRRRVDMIDILVSMIQHTEDSFRYQRLQEELIRLQEELARYQEFRQSSA